MTTQEILENIRAAKRAHVRWLGSTQALVAGMRVNDTHTPVNYTECEFGKWYYGSGLVLSQFATYRTIEGPHKTIHMLYTKLFNLLFIEAESDFLQSVTGATSKLEKAQQREVFSILGHMLSASTHITNALDALEREVLTTRGSAATHQYG